MAKQKIDLLTVGEVLSQIWHKTVVAVLAKFDGETSKASDALHRLNSDNDDGRLLREDIADVVAGQATLVRRKRDKLTHLEYEVLGKLVVAIRDVTNVSRRVQLGDIVKIMARNRSLSAPGDKCCVWQISSDQNDSIHVLFLNGRHDSFSLEEVEVISRVGGADTDSW